MHFSTVYSLYTFLIRFFVLLYIVVYPVYMFVYRTRMRLLYILYTGAEFKTTLHERIKK